MRKKEPETPNNDQEVGIDLWAILYVVFPVIGIVVAAVYYTKGNIRKGRQAFFSFLAGMIIFRLTIYFVLGE